MKKFTPIIKELGKRAVKMGKKQESADKAMYNAELILETLLANTSVEMVELIMDKNHGGNYGLITDVRRLKEIADERKEYRA